MRQLLCVLLLMTTSFGVAAQGRNAIGYPSVAAALADLKAKKGADIRVQDGWTIIDDKAAHATWAFVPAGHPAYPALVKRSSVTRGDAAGVEMTSRCHAGKTTCDKLIAEFEKLDHQTTPDTQRLPAAGIDVQRLGDDTFRLVLTSYTSKSADAGRAELLPKARQLCGDKSANFGKYEFKLSESYRNGSRDQAHLSLTQMLSCGAAVDEPLPANPN
jgi:hypothetical protein